MVADAVGASAAGLRHRDRVRGPTSYLHRFEKLVGYPADPAGIVQAVTTNSMQELRPTSSNQNFWEG
jgi:hypothetical protein